MENLFKIFLFGASFYLIFLGVRIAFSIRKKNSIVSEENASLISIIHYRENLNDLIIEIDQEKQRKHLSVENLLWQDDFSINISNNIANNNLIINTIDLGSTTVFARRQMALYRRQVFSPQKEKMKKISSFGDLCYV